MKSDDLTVKRVVLAMIALILLGGVITVLIGLTGAI